MRASWAREAPISSSRLLANTHSGACRSMLAKYRCAVVPRHVTAAPTSGRASFVPDARPTRLFPTLQDRTMGATTAGMRRRMTVRRRSHRGAGGHILRLSPRRFFRPSWASGWRSFSRALHRLFSGEWAPWPPSRLRARGPRPLVPGRGSASRGALRSPRPRSSPPAGPENSARLSGRMRPTRREPRPTTCSAAAELTTLRTLGPSAEGTRRTSPSPTRARSLGRMTEPSPVSARALGRSERRSAFGAAFLS